MIRMILGQSSPTHNLISTSQRIFASSTPKIPIVTDPSPVAPRPRRSHPKPSWFTHWFSQNHLSCHLLFQFDQQITNTAVSNNPVPPHQQQ